MSSNRRAADCAGAIITAQGMAAVTAGLGSSYITYDWSACAMLLVMHYFAGMPFKRIESLQAGWGIPLPDANQWTIANTSADLLFPALQGSRKARHRQRHRTAHRRYRVDGHRCAETDSSGGR